MTREAFEMSEHFGLPVLVRLVTRLAHSRAKVITKPQIVPAPRARVVDWHTWTLLPVNARQRFGRLLRLQPDLQEYAERSRFNPLTLRGAKGVIVTGRPPFESCCGQLKMWTKDFTADLRGEGAW